MIWSEKLQNKNFEGGEWRYHKLERERVQTGSDLNWKREEQCPVNGNEERGYTVGV